MSITFDDFLQSAGTEYADYINALHAFLKENNCIYKIREAANGFVASYIHKPTKRTVANFLFRNKLPMLRVYADNISLYTDITHLPITMKNIIRKGGDCIRLSNPMACNSRCLKGFEFMLDGELQRKCRCHMSFTFPLNYETQPHLLDIMKCEMQARSDIMQYGRRDGQRCTRINS